MKQGSIVLNLVQQLQENRLLPVAVVMGTQRRVANESHLSLLDPNLLATIMSHLFTFSLKNKKANVSVWAFVYYAVKSLNARSLHRCTLVDF
jgi:ribosomal protein L39E